MTTEQRHTFFICIIISIIAVLGIILGIKYNKPLITVFAVIPPIIYELRLTKGIFAKSILFLSFIIALAEIYAIITLINVDLSKMTGGLFTNTIRSALIGPIILVIFSIYLLKYTIGIYAKWLSIIILLSSIVLFFIIPDSKKLPDVQESIKTEIQI